MTDWLEAQAVVSARRLLDAEPGMIHPDSLALAESVLEIPDNVTPIRRQ